MKLIMENWRHYLQEEEENLEEISMPKGGWGQGDIEDRDPSEYSEAADEAWEYLQKYLNDIYAAAKQQDLKPSLVIGILMDEYIRMYPRALGDLLGYFGLTNTSMGIGQTKGETAKKISEKGLYVPPGYSSDMSLGELQRLIAGDDIIGINYTAAYIRYVEDLWGKDVWAEVSAEEKDAIIMTLYSHPSGEKPRRPGEEAWKEKGAPGASERGRRAAAAGRRVAPAAPLGLAERSRGPKNETPT